MRLRNLLPLLALVCVAGCASKQHLSAKEYIEQATASFREHSYALAIDQYKELLDQHPFSEYNEEAELRIAHADYLNETYPEAVVALTDFQRRHPTSPHLAFVGYLLGMCYVQQIGTIDRDNTAAQNAQSYFITVAQQFPASPFADLARQKLARCREHLAEHEMYVADYYAGQGHERAAEIRLLDLAARYDETPQSAMALSMLGKRYEQAGQTREAILAYRAVIQLYSRSDEALAAKAALANLAAVDGADGRDPLEVLLALNHRERRTSNHEAVPVPVPGLEPKGPRTPAAVPGGPGIGTGFDPFGRGGRGGRGF